MVRQLPQIKSIELVNNKAVITLYIQPELKYFSGHFEHFPILPGVAQLDWAIYYASEYFKQSFQLSGMDLIKYQQPVKPGALLTLELLWLSDKNKLQFHYFDHECTYSKGKVKLR
ncbi:hypothetical protein BCU68_03610 [Vibrio sp. 10N.286.49.B3]|uniref:ApeI family dehydratase n=1 Tax=Vibrio sp. 10N.286.49.B3 TaxID=1880855 RepID=UPI000CC78041|nr:3-hydroxyacyl-ACP dehydratase [Vibrio sp. 10N.286.49.B3]PMH44597.1 hypothetical protein BCU68_03610 [Vibrio sp. 10N.286.49.B3]